MWNYAVSIFLQSFENIFRRRMVGRERGSLMFSFHAIFQIKNATSESLLSSWSWGKRMGPCFFKNKSEESSFIRKVAKEGLKNPVSSPHCSLHRKNKPTHQLHLEKTKKKSHGMFSSTLRHSLHFPFLIYNNYPTSTMEGTNDKHIA